MRSILCSMSGVNPAQENKKGVGAKQILSRGPSKLCSYFKKKKIEPLILFILSLTKHFLGIAKNCLASPCLYTLNSMKVFPPCSTLQPKCRAQCPA